MSNALPSPEIVPHGVVGRYAVFDEIAAGGMATVHLGKLAGAGGFSRVVAIKRLHPQFAKDAEFAAMFMDEARLAARIHHPNVVQTLDVVPVEKELLLVMEYIHGVPLSALLHASRKLKQRVEPRILAGILAGVLEGLHAAHDAKSEVGTFLNVVHRDVSPQNVLVGLEGVPRILDFGVAKAMGKVHATREGQLKGKLQYMSPEQIRGGDEVTRQSDIFSAGVVLWEALMGERLFNGDNPAEVIMQVMANPIPPPRSRFPDLPPALDAVVMKALARDTPLRYATARAMAMDLEAAVGLAPAREIGRWVEAMAGDALAARAQLLERIERTAAISAATPLAPSSMAWLAQDEALLPTSPSARSGVEIRPGTMGGVATLPEPRSDVGLRDESRPISSRPLSSRPRPPPRPPASRPPVPMGGTPNTPAVAPLTPTPLAPPLRAHRIPTRAVDPADAERSLRERLEPPLKVVALGVVLSVVDVVVRPYTESLALPVRPLLIAEILVVVGVLWALARVVLPSSRG